MSTRPEIHFFIGKGGVGKSTTSALTALFLAASGKNTLLVSMDPAHNQRDLFEADFSEKPKQVVQHLAVKEIDTAHWTAKCLKETRENIRKNYLYESAFNLQDHFKVLQFSPGLEEYALLTAFEDVLGRASDKDVVIFDMAPTALTLRFFSLPNVTLVWLNQLLTLRRQICQKKEIISKIRIGTCEMERDRVKEKLQTLIGRHTGLRDRFLSEDSRIHLVMNVDRLSFSEAVRIKKRLADIHIGIDRVVVNKSLPGNPIGELPETLEPHRLAVFPLASGTLVGLQAMQEYLQAQQESFADLLTRPLTTGQGS